MAVFNNTKVIAQKRIIIQQNSYCDAMQCSIVTDTSTIRLKKFCPLYYLGLKGYHFIDAKLSTNHDSVEYT